jgi:RNA polymerase sigma-70 factor (sigma-E family)
MTTGGHGADGTREDELLTRLYYQVTEQQAARFGAGYDVGAGLDRYRTWLCEHAAQERAMVEAIQASTVWTLRASADATSAVTAALGHDESVTAGEMARERTGIHCETPGIWADQDADRIAVALYSTHYRSLVRLAALLVQDITTAEELVQDSFVAMHSAGLRPPDSDHALSYLRQSVVNRSRSVLRHRAVADKLAPDLPGAEQEPVGQLERSALVSALRALPARQREVLVLRYYAEMSEAQTASAMGISKNAVKSYTARAMSSLRAELRTGEE